MKLAFLLFVAVLTVPAISDTSYNNVFLDRIEKTLIWIDGWNEAMFNEVSEVQSLPFEKLESSYGLFKEKAESLFNTWQSAIGAIINVDSDHAANPNSTDCEQYLFENSILIAIHLNKSLPRNFIDSFVRDQYANTWDSFNDTKGELMKARNGTSVKISSERDILAIAKPLFRLFDNFERSIVEDNLLKEYSSFTASTLESIAMDGARLFNETLDCRNGRVPHA